MCECALLYLLRWMILYDARMSVVTDRRSRISVMEYI